MSKSRTVGRTPEELPEVRRARHVASGADERREPLGDAVTPVQLELDAGRLARELEHRRGDRTRAGERIDDELPRPAPGAHQRLEHAEGLVVRVTAPGSRFSIVVASKPSAKTMNPVDRSPGRGEPSWERRTPPDVSFAVKGWFSLVNTSEA